MRRTLCDPPVTHQSCDILAGESTWPGPEALGRSRYCGECPALLADAFGLAELGRMDSRAAPGPSGFGPWRPADDSEDSGRSLSRTSKKDQVLQL